MEALISVLVGVIGVPLVGWLKDKLNWKGRKVLLVAGLVSGVLAAVALFVSGEFTGASFTLEELPTTLALVFATSQVVYRLIAG